VPVYSVDVYNIDSNVQEEYADEEPVEDVEGKFGQ
jgi:hypothetical protein